MKTHAQIVIIGGGVIGCSILYHLTQLGIKDCVLLERDELTSGSTWHAAGLLPLFNMSYTVGQIHRDSINLYQALSRQYDRDVGWRQIGNLRMARRQERMDEYAAYASTADSLGIEYQWWTPGQIADRFPLVNIEGLKGAIYHPQDGYINSADITLLLADAARAGGAEIYRQTQADAITLMASGEWRITTKQGEIICQTVVTATGNHALRSAAMFGVTLPAIPVEHQYIVTDAIAEIVNWREQGNVEHPVLRDADARFYMREERGGLILGPYEAAAKSWAADGVPEHFRADLLAPDLDRLEWHIEQALFRMPCFAKGGVKQVYNGPISYTPDGNPLVGPVPGHKNAYFAEGFSFGVTAAGGIGKQLALMITKGEAEFDMLALDPRRFGDYAGKPYAVRKNEEAYGHVFIIHFPDEERPAARPLRCAPSYDRLKQKGAVFGQKFGWERANFFATPGHGKTDHGKTDHGKTDHGKTDHGKTDFVEKWSFRRSNWWSFVENEAKTIRNHAGLIEAGTFAKYMVSGKDAFSFLNRLVANQLPKIGHIALCHACTPRGGIRSEFTIMRDSEQDFYLVGAGAMEAYDWDYLTKMRPEGADVQLQKVTNQWGVFVVAGPKSREILQPLADIDLGNAYLPWLCGRHCHIGLAPVRLLRINYVGELGWEIHHPIEYHNYLYDLLEQSAPGDILRPVGMRAMNWLRLEKSYRAIGAELSKEVSALESGMQKFIRFDKNSDFIGRDALLQQQQNQQFSWRLATLLIDGPNDGDPWGSEAILCEEGNVAGRATAGGYSVHFGKQIAMAFLRPQYSNPEQPLKIKMINGQYAAKIVCDSPYDPQNSRLRDL